MIFAIISSLLDALGNVFWKKSLSYNPNKDYFYALDYISVILISAVLFLTGNFSVESISFQIFFLILFVLCSTYSLGKIEQYIYQNDKISAILPYTNISKITTIIFGFFLFGDVSVFTLCIAIFTTCIIIAFSIDFKNHSIPKNLKLITLSEILYAINLLIIGFILKQITNISYFFYEYILGIIFILLIIFIKKIPKDVYKLPKKFYTDRLTAAHLGGISYIISLLVISELGITMSILISYVGFGATLFFSYLILKDKPKKKDMLLLFIVLVLIGIGYYFK